MSRWTKFQAFLRYRRDATRRFRADQPLDEWSLENDELGFTVNYVSYRPFLARLQTVERVEWAEVSRVIAYKVDNSTWDTVWLEFELPSGAFVRMPEETRGWKDLIESLPLRLSGAVSAEEWWPAVVQPAFAQNATQVYPPPPNNSSKPTPLRGAA